MTRRDGIAATLAAGTILGLATLVAEDGGFPTSGLNAAIDFPFVILATAVFLLTPIVVARWWALLAMTGPVVSLLILQWAGVAVSLDDGTGPALNYRTLFQLALLSLVMLSLVVIRALLGAPAARRRQAQSDQPG